jgi:FKBP-type peptidyl-prolyl cis-trans isomerase 2
MRPFLRRVAALAVALLPALAASAEDAAAPKVVGEGSKVSIEYTLKLDDGTTADSNVGGEPLVYEQGKGDVLPALEKQLVGLKVDDTKKVKLSPEDGYGPVNPEAFHAVPASQIPEEARSVGATMIAEDGSGRRQRVRVHELKGDEIVVDLNHPLAGKTLHFDVKILAIQ